MEKSKWVASEIDPTQDEGKLTIRERVGRRIVQFLEYIDDNLGVDISDDPEEAR